MKLPVPLGAYELRAPLARGGMGEVWTAWSPAHGGEVAIKAVTADAARHEAYRRAFREEVRAVARLDHPNIVLVLDHGEVTKDVEEATRGRLTRGSPWLAMEKLGGGSLEDFAPAGSSWEEVKSLVLVLLDALAHAHARGVLHRDIKPGNVLLADPVSLRTSDGRRSIRRPVLVDFGIASAREPGPEHREERPTGTPQYMAPEQCRTAWRDYGPWTDLYALGCVVWRLVTGAPPFFDVPGHLVLQAHLHTDVPPLRPRMAVPSGLVDWLGRILEKDWHHRFWRAADAAYELERLGPSDVPAVPEPAATDPSEDSTWMHDDPRTETTEPAAVTSRELPIARRAAAPVAPPMPKTWQIERPRRAASAGLSMYGLRTVPFVDREEARDRIWSALATARGAGGTAGSPDAGGGPRFVVLRGPPGCGKTRLAAVMAERADELGLAWVLHAVHGPRDSASYGLGPMISRYMRCVGLGRDEIRHRVERWLSAAGEATPRAIEDLTDLLSPMGPFETRLPALLGWLRALGRSRPVLVRLDDVQWSPEALLFCLRLAEAAEAGPIPVTVLLTVREDALAERPTERRLLQRLLARPEVDDVRVGPLDDPSQRDLVAGALDLDSALVDAIAKVARGRPVFAVQICSDLVESGALRREGAVYRLQPGSSIPSDLAGLWARRMDRVARNPGEVGALEIAAALDGDVRMDEWKAACRAAGVSPGGVVEALFETGHATRTDEGWRFTHPMVAELFEAQSRAAGRWAGWNRACVAGLRAVHGDAISPSRLGVHALEAGDLEVAASALDDARGLVRAVGADRAIELLQRRNQALADLGRRPDDPDRLKARLDVAWAQLLAGSYADAAIGLESALDDAEKAGELGAAGVALTRLGLAARLRGEMARSLACFRRAVDLTEALGDRRHAAPACRGLSRHAADTGDVAKAMRYAQRAYDHALSVGDTMEIAAGLQDRARVHEQAGEDVAAEQLYLQALGMYERTGQPFDALVCINGLADIARRRGDLDAAERDYRRALERIEWLGFADVVVPRLNLGLVALERDRLDEADRWAKLCIEQADRQKRYQVSAFGDLIAAAVAAGRARWQEFDRHFDRGVAMMGDTVDVDAALCAQKAGEKAMIAGERGRATRALRFAQRLWQQLKRPEREAQAERMLHAMAGRP